MTGENLWFGWKNRNTPFNASKSIGEWFGEYTLLNPANIDVHGSAANAG